MKYTDFREQLRAYPYFRSHIFAHLTDKPNILRRQVTEWCRKGQLWELRRGMYTLPDNERSVPLSSLFLANQLYSPSYISLETALSYYKMIPERVTTVTSVSSKKTQRFHNPLGTFTYQHIKQTGFRHFISHTSENNQDFLMATPEKALLDFMYFRTAGMRTIDKSIFTLSWRLQNLDILQIEQLRRIAETFDSKKLLHFVEVLIEFMGEDHV